MTILAYIFLAAATTIWLYLLTTLYGQPPPAQANVSYIWTTIIVNISFGICLFIVSIFGLTLGVFDWVSSTKSGRYGIVLGGLFVSLLAVALAALFRYEPKSPLPSIYSNVVPFVIPLILFIILGILFIPSLRVSVPLIVIKWSLMLTVAFGLLGVVPVVLGFVSQTQINQANRIEELQSRDSENEQRILKDIANWRDSSHIVYIIGFTNENWEGEIKEKAVAKLKSKKDWESQVIELLDSEFAANAFQFLASNEVDNRELFLEPINMGIKKQASLLREKIRNNQTSLNLYADSYCQETERILQTVNEYSGFGVDYLPAIKELRSVFMESSKSKFTCLQSLDEWIKLHE